MPKAMKMEGVLAGALLSLRMPWPSAEATEYLEPNVRRHAGVLPPSVCKQLIDLGEKSGFLVPEVEESIGGSDTNKQPSQQIDVYGGKDDVRNEEIWDVIKWYKSAIANIVKENRNKEEFSKFYPDDPDRKPVLDWVFFRKYSPRSERNSLELHHDHNMNTVVVELNDEWEGGGMFYIKRLAATGKIAEAYDDLDDDLDWIEHVKRQNLTDVIFPDLHSGDALFYNYTVEHAIAPIDSGTRYSMAFFFDMDNPGVEIEYNLDDDDSEDGYSEDQNYEHEDSEDADSEDEDSEDEAEDENTFTVELHNELPSTELSLVLVYDGIQKKRTREEIIHKIAPDRATVYHAHEGDIIWALVEGAEEAVSQLEIRRDQSVYTVSEVDMETMDKDAAFNIKLHNELPDVALDLVLVYDGARQEGVWEMFDSVTPDETTLYPAYEGDRLWAFVEGTDVAVSELEIKHDQLLYKISEMEYLLSSEL